jgi:hypothetical protein
VIDFVNLKINPTQYFRDTHRGRVCMRVFIGMSARICISIYVCTVFLKKIFCKISYRLCEVTLGKKVLCGFMQAEIERAIVVTRPLFPKHIICMQ